MEAAVPYAVDEQMRVEALRAAVAIVCAANCSAPPNTVVSVAEYLLAWLLDEPVGEANLNAALEGSD